MNKLRNYRFIEQVMVLRYSDYDDDCLYIEYIFKMFK